MDINELYQQTIKKHAKAPRYGRLLPEEPADASGTNPTCGDEIRIKVDWEGDIIRELRCDAQGCLISLAAASMLAAWLKGKTRAEARQCAGQLMEFVKEENLAVPEGWGDLASLNGVKRFPGRKTCVLLPFETFLKT